MSKINFVDCAFCGIQVCVCDHVRLSLSGIGTQTQRAEAAEARVQALEAALSEFVRPFVQTHGLSWMEARADLPGNERIAFVTEIGPVRVAVEAWKATRAAHRAAHRAEARLAEALAAIALLRQRWDQMTDCANEFEPEDTTACAERRDLLDDAILAVLAAGQPARQGEPTP